MTFYIQNFMPGTSDSPSVADIIIPGGGILRALLATDLSIQLANRFGNLLPGVEMLSDIAQAIGSVNIPAWIGASVQGWRGTDPVKLNLELFLINYEPNLGYEAKLKALAKLATITPSSREGVAGHLSQQVHGGYSTKASAFATNKQFFQDSVSDEQYVANKDGNKVSNENQLGAMKDVGQTIWEGKGGAAGFTGTLTIKVGNRFELKNLLLTAISITPSSVEVYSPSSGERPKPLYYRISMSVMTCRTALYTDVDSMFQ